MKTDLKNFASLSFLIASVLSLSGIASADTGNTTTPYTNDPANAAHSNAPGSTGAPGFTQNWNTDGTMGANPSNPPTTGQSAGTVGNSTDNAPNSPGSSGSLNSAPGNVGGPNAYNPGNGLGNNAGVAGSTGTSTGGSNPGSGTGAGSSGTGGNG